MQLVESFATESETEIPVVIDDEIIPVPALVQDEEGFRYLLLGAGQTIPVRTWVKAYESGACALLARDPGGAWLLLGAQQFIAERTELPAQAAYGIPSGWVAYPHQEWTFTDLVGYFPPEMFTNDDTYTKTELAQEPSTVEGRFVSLHTHTEYSALDGFSRIQEMVDFAVADGQGALAASDHGNCVSHPELQAICQQAGIKPIFGMEAYFVADRHRRPKKWTEMEDGKEVAKSDTAEVRDYQHMTLWAMTDAGLRNLWAMSTEAFREGFYYYPRLDWETLDRLNEGVMASTGCLRGPLAQAILAGDDMAARMVLGRLLDIFDDRLYIELHTNTLPDQVKVNQASVGYAMEYNIPLIACTDSHYTHHEDAQAHHTWLAVQTNKDVTEDSSLFGGAADYYMHTADEVEQALSYLPSGVVAEAMANTVVVANRCTALISGVPTAPTYSKGENAIADDERRLREICQTNWVKKATGRRDPEEIYRARFEREMDLLVRKQFCGYFLVVEDYVSAAKREGILAGPCRGSGGGSLVAYLAGIEEIDPIYYDLMFERFLTEGRNELPDFDMDFPASKRDWIKDYLRKRWGEDNAISIGTQLRLQSKGAIDSAQRALKPVLRTPVDYNDLKLVSKIIDEIDRPLAGKHTSWEDLWTQFGELLGAYRDKYPEVFAAADQMVGRLKSYGKHAAGMVISTDKPLTDLPLRLGDDGHMTTQFDMNALAELGYVKFDLLTLRTLDTIQVALDEIERRYGKRINLYELQEELDDPEIWDQVSDGHTLGIFQIETAAGTKLTKQLRPASVDDLAIIGAIVRPGPMRSGLTEMYLRRRAGNEVVTYPDPRMESFLKTTLGCIIFQEQILATTMTLAGYDETEADGVRKILGKKLVEKIGPAGQEFKRRAVECGTDMQVAESLWAQMEEFAKYSFGKAHSYGYAIIGTWTAWLKFHFEVEFMTAVLSTVDDDRIPDFVRETRRLGYRVLPPDINISGVDFSSTTEGVRYGLSSVKGVGKPTAQKIVARQPYDSIERFQETSGANTGITKTLAAVGSFDSLYPNRRALESQLEWATSDESICCQHKIETTTGPGGLPCGFDWSAEIDPPMVRIPRKDQIPGGPTQAPKSPPKRCTVACRNYTPPEPLQIELIRPYTADDIINREKELLGVYLTSTPFDRIDPEDLKTLHKASEIEAGPYGRYITVGLVNRIRPHTTKSGNRMAFLGILAQDGDLDVAVFPEEYAKHRQDLATDALLVMVLRKAERGLVLDDLAPA